MTKITATDVKENFAEFANRTLYLGEKFLVERHGKPVCEIVPVRAISDQQTESQSNEGDN